MILCCLLASVASDEKSPVICTAVLLSVVCLPSTAFKIFSSSLVFSILTKTCLGMLFFGFILLVVCWDSWICTSICFIKFWRLYTLRFIFPMFFVLQACWAVWYCPVGFWGFVHFPSNLIISTDLSPSSLTLSSVITKLLLSPFSEWTIWFWNFYLVL